MQHAADEPGLARRFLGRFASSASADELFEHSLSGTNKFSLWIQLVVGFGFAVLFLHYCCVEAIDQEHFSFLFFTFWTSAAVVTLQLIAMLCAMSVIAFSFMMTYVHKIGSLPLKIVAAAVLTWCNVALFVAMVLTARSANLTSYHPSRSLSLGSFFLDLVRHDPGKDGNDTARTEHPVEAPRH